MKKDQTESLVRRAKSHDEEAFVELLDLQMQGMYKVARSVLSNDEDAADAIQETILTCWEKLDTLREDRFFKTWMTRILLNNCYRLLDQRQKIIYTDELPEFPAPPAGDRPEWKEALESLSESYRPVVILYYVQGFRTREIAKLLGIPDTTVRTKLARARKQLEAYYKE